MITLKKQLDKDFIILCLTDPQLGNDEWQDGHKNRRILEYTVSELVKRISPDLIVITGDIAYAGHTEAYRAFADCIDSFGIPWAPIWGNHDNELGAQAVEDVVRMYSEYRNFTYERGDSALGSGNYVIAVEEDGTIVEGLILMDTHEGYSYIRKDGKKCHSYDKLSPAQLDWYRDQAASLKSLGCDRSALFVHTPICAYIDAENAAIPSYADHEKLSYADSFKPENWNEGYKNSYGCCHEEACCAHHDDGAFEVILDGGSTDHVFCGHDHVNNYAIKYKGVWMIFATKLGRGGCDDEDDACSGGTVIRITSDGIPDGPDGVFHELVDFGEALKEEE